MPHFYLNVFTRRGRTCLHLEVDTARAAPEEAEAFLRRVESVLVAPAGGDVPPGRVRALAGAWGEA